MLVFVLMIAFGFEHYLSKFFSPIIMTRTNLFLTLSSLFVSKECDERKTSVRPITEH
jgi:hypothetical protein